MSDFEGVYDHCGVDIPDELTDQDRMILAAYDPDNVKKVAEKLGVSYKVALDTIEVELNQKLKEQ